jgi:hypothetical protein
VKKPKGKKLGERVVAPRTAKPLKKFSVRKRAPAAGSISEERLFRPGGTQERVLTLDANSATFTSDLTVMFERNVARALREHKKRFGSSERGRKRA